MPGDRCPCGVDVDEPVHGLIGVPEAVRRNVDPGGRGRDVELHDAVAGVEQRRRGLLRGPGCFQLPGQGRQLCLQLLHPGGHLVVGAGRSGNAGEVALDVGGEHRHTTGRKLLGEELEGDGLAGAGGASDEPVTVAHGEGHLHRGVGERGAVMHRPTDVDARVGGGVAGGDPCGEVIGHGGRR